MTVVEGLLNRLRAAGGDTADIEVKAAAGGLPDSVTSSLCGLANLPGGGWVVLGLDEANQFAPVALGDRQALRQGLVGRARACVPPVALEFFDEQVSGSPVVVARVAECDPSAKPCRDGVSGRAWTRGGDGDYQMSPLEEQAFLAARQPSLFDRRPVEGATFQDLDPQLLSTWEKLVHERDPAGLGRFKGRELLVRSGVLTGDGVPTMAGLLTLGLQPQQFFPRFVVNLASTAPGVRVAAPETVSGPIPQMLESALDWARRVFRVDVVGGPEGTVRDVYEYPLEAFRELVGNALVHRDLDAWSEGMAIEVRHRPDRLVVTNPGGLYGITVDRLGRPGTTSARNGRLIELCRYARTSDGGRDVETVASGIPRVLETLALDGHPSPLFIDTGIRFTVVLLPRGQVAKPDKPQVETDLFALGPTERKILRALELRPAGSAVDDLEDVTGLKPPNIRRVLRLLAAKGFVEKQGGQGRPTIYRQLPRP